MEIACALNPPPAAEDKLPRSLYTLRRIVWDREEGVNGFRKKRQRKTVARYSLRSELNIRCHFSTLRIYFLVSVMFFLLYFTRRRRAVETLDRFPKIGIEEVGRIRRPECASLNGTLSTTSFKALILNTIIRRLAAKFTKNRNKLNEDSRTRSNLIACFIQRR